MWLWSACSIFALTDLKNIPKDVCLSAYLKAGLTWLLGNTQDKKNKKSLREDPYSNKLAAPRWQNTITLARIYHTDQSTQSLREVVLRQEEGAMKTRDKCTQIEWHIKIITSTQRGIWRGACGDFSVIWENVEFQFGIQRGQEVLSLFPFPDQFQTMWAGFVCLLQTMSEISVQHFKQIWLQQSNLMRMNREPRLSQSGSLISYRPALGTEYFRKSIVTKKQNNTIQYTAWQRCRCIGNERWRSLHSWQGKFIERKHY